MVRFCRRAILALALVAVAASSVMASGYTYSKGFWWYNGEAYTRENVRYYHPSCGYYWQYKYTRAAYADEAKNLDYTKSGWREKLLELLKQRDAYVLSARSQAAEAEAFDRALGALGDMKIEGYGEQYAAQSYGRGGYDDLQYQQVAQGSSLYGVTSATATIGGVVVDANEAFNHAARLNENQSRYAAEGYQQFMQAVDKASEQVLSQQSLEAEYAAKSAMVERILAAAEPTARSLTIRREDGSVTTSETEGPTQQSILSQSCLQCHSGDSAKGKVRFDQAISVDLLRRARDQVLEGKMPPADSGVTIDDATRGEVLMGLIDLVQP